MAAPRGRQSIAGRTRAGGSVFTAGSGESIFQRTLGSGRMASAERGELHGLGCIEPAYAVSVVALVLNPSCRNRRTPIGRNIVALQTFLGMRTHIACLFRSFSDAGLFLVIYSMMSQNSIKDYLLALAFFVVSPYSRIPQCCASDPRSFEIDASLGLQLLLFNSQKECRYMLSYASANSPFKAIIIRYFALFIKSDDNVFLRRNLCSCSQ